ncbi:MAG: hypothetical protein A3D21_03710 [Nitrospirae bacterium RIFCSPHIGHO2_02_FULL_42_12]|nr:MAG: hypothetical protein A3D21_03710 [Nitrospirae bacterium RIFCSPHIGHO2_02_FULL_42_12]
MKNIKKRFLGTIKGILDDSKAVIQEDLPVKIIKRCPLKNIYHCCTHKSGSQWIKAILKDEIVFAYSGLEVYTYAKSLPDKTDKRKITDRYFDTPFPEDKIISPLYITYDSYIKIPKRGSYKAIYILRDPRDLVVSYYFSTMYSHAPLPGIDAKREKLIDMELNDGLTFCMQNFIDRGHFEAQRSWIHACDDTVMLVRYEDLVGPHSEDFFKKIFDHCKIELTEYDLQKLLDKYSFEKLSKGRKQGEENQRQHYRKGIAGDWKNYFSDDVKDVFKQKTGDLLIALKYERDMNW